MDTIMREAPLFPIHSRDERSVKRGSFNSSVMMHLLY
jgi:hypothetical protein